jgi:hypothetical protein
MIRGQFNDTVQQQASRLDDFRHILSLYPNVGSGSARLPENHRFVSRTTMPIHDPELPLRI